MKYVGDDRVLTALHDAEPWKVGLLQDSVGDTDRFYKPFGKPYRNIDLLAWRILEYFSVVPQEFERLKVLEDEINHFRNITVSLKDISDLAGRVEAVRRFEEPEPIKRQVREKLRKQSKFRWRSLSWGLTALPSGRET